MAMNGFCENDLSCVPECVCVCYYVENGYVVCKKVLWNLKMKSGNDQVYEAAWEARESNRTVGNNKRLCLNLISISLDIKLNFLLLDKTHMKNYRTSYSQALECSPKCRSVYVCVP